LVSKPSVNQAYTRASNYTPLDVCPGPATVALGWSIAQFPRFRLLAPPVRQRGEILFRAIGVTPEREHPTFEP
jgi:hypothetical protein